MFFIEQILNSNTDKNMIDFYKTLWYNTKAVKWKNTMPTLKRYFCKYIFQNIYLLSLKIKDRYD